MKNYIKHHKALFLLASVLMSCTGDFEEINKNKNLPGTVSTSSLLTAIIFDPVNPIINMQMKFTGQIMQYMVYTNENAFDIYNFSGDATVTDAYWTAAYKALRNSRDMRDIKGVDDGYVAASKIMDAYYLAVATDLWGSVPNSEAGLGGKNSNPAYDSQQEVFTTVLNNLKEANQLLSTGGTYFSQGGDVLFASNVMNWRKMANSLRLRYLLRVSKAVSTAQADFEQILADPEAYPIITSNDDSAVYDISGVAPNQSDFSRRSSLSGITVSQRFINKTDGGTPADYSDDDPRLGFLTRMRSDGADDETDARAKGYVGAISGESEASAKTSETYSNSVKIDTKFIQDKGLLDLGYITAAEMKFILAEAKLKGWNVPKTVEQYYQEGIQASFDYWGLTMPADFLVRSSVALDGIGTSDDTKIERILNQKWIAGFMVNTFDTWGDYKRTGFPTFTIGAKAQGISTDIPNRMLYPILEQTVNVKNYEDATGSQPESITSRQWYQN